MIIRKLEQSEHIATRKLWEEIFPEDTKAFLDYYYYIKAFILQPDPIWIQLKH